MPGAITNLQTSPFISRKEVKGLMLLQRKSKKKNQTLIVNLQRSTGDFTFDITTKDGKKFQPRKKQRQMPAREEQ